VLIAAAPPACQLIACASSPSPLASVAARRPSVRALNAKRRSCWNASGNLNAQRRKSASPRSRRTWFGPAVVAMPRNFQRRENRARVPHLAQPGAAFPPNPRCSAQAFRNLRSLTQAAEDLAAGIQRISARNGDSSHYRQPRDSSSIAQADKRRSSRRLQSHVGKPSRFFTSHAARPAVKCTAASLVIIRRTTGRRMRSASSRRTTPQ